LTTFQADYRLNPPVSNEQLDRLYAAAWPHHQPPFDFGPELEHLLAFIGAYVDDQLIGCVKVAWDGAVHAFLLEPRSRGAALSEAATMQSSIDIVVRSLSIYSIDPNGTRRRDSEVRLRG
jgi:hypothetical protein